MNWYTIFILCSFHKYKVLSKKKQYYYLESVDKNNNK